MGKSLQRKTKKSLKMMTCSVGTYLPCLTGGEETVNWLPGLHAALGLRLLCGQQLTRETENWRPADSQSGQEVRMTSHLSISFLTIMCNQIIMRGEKRGKGFCLLSGQRGRTLGKREFCGFEVSFARFSGIFRTLCLESPDGDRSSPWGF